jgi:hypothetical protein
MGRKTYFLKIAIITVSFTLLSWGAYTNLYASTHYVDNAANGSNNGSSWNDAWESFADISWSAVNPGDMLYISGGSTSKTYHETLEVTRSGVNGKPITITRSGDENHDGIIIIDGNDSNNCAVIERCDYISISHIQCQNGGQNSGSGTIHVDNSSHVKIENCNFPEIDTHGAVFVQRSDNILIGNNTITSMAYTSSQTDGIYSQHNTANIYENNKIIIYNQNTTPHCDGIQSYNDSDLTIRGNYIEQDNTKRGNAQGIYATAGGGTFRFYNNVVYCPNSSAGLIAYHYQDSGARVEMYNNTATGASTNLMVISGPDSIVKNNILNGTGYNSVLVVIDPLTDISSQIDFNIYNSSGSDLVYFAGSMKSWNEWRNLGAEAHGAQNAPGLDSSFRPSSILSPAVDSGTNLSTLFTIDKTGVRRPQGSAWDIGAFEYTGGLNTPLIKPPTNLRLITQSQ